MDPWRRAAQDNTGQGPQKAPPVRYLPQRRGTAAAGALPATAKVPNLVWPPAAPSFISPQHSSFPTGGSHPRPARRPR